MQQNSVCVCFCDIDVNLNGNDSDVFMKLLRNWISLDNQSTTDIFCNKNLLKDMRETNDETTRITNGGTLVTNMNGQLEDYGLVWCHPEEITNVLSLARVIELYPVTYSSKTDNNFVVHKPEGDCIFLMVKAGLW